MTARPPPTIEMADLTKGFHRNSLEPGLRLIRFALAKLIQRIDRAREARTYHLDENIVPRLVIARLRKSIAGRHGVVTGAFDRRPCGRCSGKQARDHSRASL